LEDTGAGMRNSILRTGLDALYFSGSHCLMRPFVGGVGAILTLRHVRPARREGFQPNRFREVTPQFLENLIKRLRRAGLELIGLDDLYCYLLENDFRRRFVCLTFDGGYRDTLRFAYPILRKHQVPFALFIPTSFPDRIGELWWFVVETVIANNDRIGLVIDEEDRRFECGSLEQKRDVFQAVDGWLRALPSDRMLRRVVRDLASRYDVDRTALCRDLCMTWAELTELAADPLVTIGAHSVNHVALRMLDGDGARSEMRMSRSVIAAALGKTPEHFSYPMGDAASAGPREFAIARELGFKTAVTARPGVLFREHREYLTALPRIALSGELQELRYVQVLLSGAATAIYNGFRRVDAA